MAMTRLFALLMLLSSLPAWADFNESTECPGKSSPRADIRACYSFDDTSDCTTGYEAQCRTDNGVSGWGVNFGERAMRIRATGGPITGAGWLEFAGGVWGQNTGGFQTIPASSIASREFSLRFYHRFGPGAGDYASNTDHSMQIITNVNCDGTTTDYGMDGGVNDDWFISARCGSATLNLITEQLLPGVWRLIEMRGKAETVDGLGAGGSDSDCDTSDGFYGGTGCDGTFEVYVDGVQTLSKTDMNWFAGSATGVFEQFLLPRTYYAGGFAPWGYFKGWAGIVIGDDADTPIGASANQAADLGTAYSTRNYAQAGGVDPYINTTGDLVRAAESDCAESYGPFAISGGSSLSTTYFDIDTTRNDGVFDWESVCSGAGTDGSLSLPANGADTEVNRHAVWDMNKFIPNSRLYDTGGGANGFSLFKGGSIFVHSGGDWTDGPTVVGIKTKGPSCSASFCEALGLGIEVIGGVKRWTLQYRYRSSVGDYFGPATTIWWGPKVIEDRWHRYEVGVIGTDGTMRLWLNNVLYVASIDVPGTTIGGNDQYAGFAGYIYRDVSKLKSLNFDSDYTSTVSYMDCTGWGTDCELLTWDKFLTPTGVLTPGTPTVTGN